MQGGDDLSGSERGREGSWERTSTAPAISTPVLQRVMPSMTAPTASSTYFSSESWWMSFRIESREPGVCRFERRRVRRDE